MFRNIAFVIDPRKVILWLTLAVCLSSSMMFAQWSQAGADAARSVPYVLSDVYRTSREQRNVERQIEAQRQAEMARIAAEERVRTAQVMTDAGLGSINTQSNRSGVTVTAGSVIGTPYERMQADNNASQVRIAQIQANERREEADNQRQFSVQQWRRDHNCPADPRTPCIVNKK